MKQYIESQLRLALQQLEKDGELPAIPAFIQIDHTKDANHGDYASNICMILAKPTQKAPRDIAKRLIEVLPESEFIEKVEIAGPGFLNFFLSHNALSQVVNTVLKERAHYGRCKLGRDKTVLLEFVSSNPTGPLHVGHGRHAAFGSVVGNLLDTVGFKVSREYYVNDAGRQMDILAVSIWLRYLASCGEKISFPANGYQGGYIETIAADVREKYAEAYKISSAEVFAGLPADEPEGGDKELYIDALVNRAKACIGEDGFKAVLDLGLERILGDIREDLAEFGVQFDNWYSERHLVDSAAVDTMLQRMKDSGHVYEHEGALWFNSTAFGDEKDRVLVRSNGQWTYFANDVAYHLAKFDRDFDMAVDIFGSDHHGYVPRMRAAMCASGIDPERLITLLVQFVTLYRGGQQVQMSTRGGNFVTLRELRDEVGNDAARFFYVMRKHEQHVDFDLDLAKSQSNENPVYYLQYAHARICSVFKQAEERGMPFIASEGLANLERLVAPQERELLMALARYPGVILDAALSYEPCLLTNYLRELAACYHSYYNALQFLVDDAGLRQARLALADAARQILRNGFTIIGISAPEAM